MNLTIDPIIYKRSELDESQRVEEVLSSFRYLNSVNPSRKEVIVQSGFDVNFKKINVIYGASGSGKSSLLGLIKEKISGEYLISGPEVDDFLIKLVGDSTKEAIELLTYVGLGEGNLFLRKFSQLSDGQKFRMRIALHINQLKKRNHNQLYNLFIDEFGSTLDSSTAKAIANSISTLVLKNHNINLFVCCNSLSVARTFNYDTLISLTFDNIPSIEYKADNVRKHKMTNTNFVIKNGSKDDYIKFKKYHYLDSENIIDEAIIHVAKIKDDSVGVQLMIPPIRKKYLDIDPYLQLINEKIITGYRMVIHPEYRSLGIGKALAIEAPKMAGYEIIETRSALYHFTPVPEYWGYNNVNKYYDDKYWSHRPANEALEDFIVKNGYNPNFMIEDIYCKDFLEKVDKEELGELIYQDSKEQDYNTINYFCYIMEECGYPYSKDKEQLVKKFILRNTKPKTEEDYIQGLKSNKQAKYGAFYKKLF